MSMLKNYLFLILFLSFGIVYAQESTEKNKPWRLSKALSLPPSLSISGVQQTRYEGVLGQFRPGQRDGDHILSLRSEFKAQYRLKNIDFTGEMIDSRQYLGSSQTPVNTTIVNTFALVQAYTTIHLKKKEDQKPSLSLDLGRFTMDLGTRRFVARAIFRNTTNSFTGLRVNWETASGVKILPFYTLPIQRRPFIRAALLDNEVEFDRENFDNQFWGVFIEVPRFLNTLSAQFSFYGSNERDSRDFATRNRNLYTPIIRLYQKPQKGQFYFDIQSAFQFGSSRETASPEDLLNLTHIAHFQYLELGYMMNNAWPLRFLIHLDYASGDHSPDDGQNNRFETLQGIRRPHYGPTGIYGSFARGNLISPGYRIVGKPHARLNFFLAHRWYWLASATDAYTAAGIRDRSGENGSFLGNQIDTRVKWDVIPGNFQLEFGFTQLFAGKYIKNAPGDFTNSLGNATYGYIQTLLKF